MSAPAIRDSDRHQHLVRPPEVGEGDDAAPLHRAWILYGTTPSTDSPGGLLMYVTAQHAGDVPFVHGEVVDVERARLDDGARQREVRLLVRPPAAVEVAVRTQRQHEEGDAVRRSVITIGECFRSWHASEVTAIHRARLLRGWWPRCGRTRVPGRAAHSWGGTSLAAGRRHEHRLLRQSGDAQLILIGPIVTPRLFTPEPGLYVDAVRIHPEWLRHLLGVHRREAADLVVPFEQLLGGEFLGCCASRAFRDAAARPAARSARHARAAVARHEMLRGAAAPCRVVWARFELIAEVLDVSERHLRRIIVDTAAGSSPKQIQRAARLGRAIAAGDRAAARLGGHRRRPRRPRPAAHDRRVPRPDRPHPGGAFPSADGRILQSFLSGHRRSAYGLIAVLCFSSGRSSTAATRVVLLVDAGSDVILDRYLLRRACSREAHSSAWPNRTVARSMTPAAIRRRAPAIARSSPARGPRCTASPAWACPAKTSAVTQSGLAMPTAVPRLGNLAQDAGKRVVCIAAPGADGTSKQSTRTETMPFNSFAGQPGGQLPTSGQISEEEYIAREERFADSIAGALKQKLARDDWDLLLVYIPLIDGLEHRYLLEDPRQVEYGDEGARAASASRSSSSADTRDDVIIASWMAALPETDFIVVSDHGMIPTHSVIVLNNVLAAGGLRVGGSDAQVRAISSGASAQIYVNAKSRFAHGTVDDADVPAVVAKVVAILRPLPLRTIATGSELAKLNLRNAHAGDVYVSAKPGFGFTGRFDSGRAGHHPQHAQPRRTRARQPLARRAPLSGEGTAQRAEPRRARPPPRRPAHPGHLLRRRSRRAAAQAGDGGDDRRRADRAAAAAHPRAAVHDGAVLF